MNNLRDLLKELTERSKEHRSYYERNETAVRTQLIDPILSALGWDTSNPDYVKHNEATTDRDIPDYALFKNKQRKLFVEAKNLKVDINNKKTIRQIADYCYHHSTDYGVLTNGMNWLLFETYQKDTGQRVVWSINFEKDNLENALAKLDTLTFQNIDHLNELTKKLKMLDMAWTEIINDQDLLTNVLSKVVQNKIKERDQNLAFSSNEIKDYIAVKFQTKDVLGLETRPIITQAPPKTPEQTKTITKRKERNEYSIFDNRIKIKLNTVHSLYKFKLIPINKDHNQFFPKHPNKFILETDIGDFTAGVYQQGTYIKGRPRNRLTEWYETHNDLAIGDRLIITALEPFERYKLEIKHN
ncbi:MAG: hypothetical protein FVQ77_14065 [Cytophagales bacterium]|nr:hypothetical protein [Cytophagales bacterium]